MKNSTSKGESSSAATEAGAYRIAGVVLIFLVIAAIVFVFVKTLVFDRPMNDRALQQALIAASVGVTVTCLIAWLLDLLQILELRSGWARVLWTVLVASVLGNSALVYKRFSTQSEAVSILCFRPLVGDASDPIRHPLELRKNAVYKKTDSFAVFVTLRDLQKDDSGNYSIDFRLAFEDRMSGRSQFHDFPFTGNAEQIVNDPARKKHKEEYRAIAPECADKNTLEAALAYQFPLKDFQSGGFMLRTTVYDKVGHNFAMSELPVQIYEDQ